MNTYEISKNIRNNVITNFVEKMKGNTILKHVKVLFPVLFYLLNHQFFLVGKGFPNDWTFNDDKLLFSKFRIDTDDMKNIPLTSVDVDNFAENGLNHLDANYDYIKKLETKKSKYEQEIESYNKLINSINLDNFDPDEKIERKNGINLKINETNKKINKIHKTLNNLKNKLNTNINYSINNYEKTIKTKIKLYSDNVVNIYDNLIKKLFYDNNIKSYSNMWKTYIQKNAITKSVANNSEFAYDYTQIINNIFKFQNTIISNTNSIKIKMTEMDIIIKYMDNVVNPYIANYFDLPQELTTSNYPLENVVDIISHITKHFIFNNFYQVIVQLFLKFFDIDSKENNKDNKYKIQIIQKLFKSNDYKLRKYIIDDLPKRATKIVLGLYNGENNGDNDIDKYNKTTVIGLFEYIITIINLNDSYQINDNLVDKTSDITNQLLKYLRENVFVFFKDYLEMFILEMKKVTDGYFRLLQTHTNMLKIIKCISDVTDEN
jgi:hypothetical protein